MIDFLLSDKAGNLGDFLSGIAILIAIAGYAIQKKQKSSSELQERVRYTFSYIRKLKKYYDNFVFLHFYQYLLFVLSDEARNEEFKVTVDAVEYKGPGAKEVVQRESFEFFLFLQEVKYVFEGGKSVDLIDTVELEKVMKSYTVQLKDFFSVVDILIAKRRQAHFDGYGNINESDFIELKTFFQEKYNFLH